MIFNERSSGDIESISSNYNKHFCSVQWTYKNLGNMFRLPRLMNEFDSIEVKGKVQRRESIIFTLCHEDNSPNIYMEINFIDKCIYEYKDGNKYEISDIDPSTIITESNFTLLVKVEYQSDDGQYFLTISIDEYDLYTFNVKNIANITYFRISNDVYVTNLCFKLR